MVNILYGKKVTKLSYFSTRVNTERDILFSRYLSIKEKKKKRKELNTRLCVIINNASGFFFNDCTYYYCFRINLYFTFTFHAHNRYHANNIFVFNSKRQRVNNKYRTQKPVVGFFFFRS